MLPYFFLFICFQIITAHECGIRRSPNRITGGKDAYLGQFPWIARIYYKNFRSFACSGTIITPRYILTAAHCVNDPIQFVRVGDNFGESPDCEGNVCAPPAQDITVAKVIPHPDYDDRIVNNDIALLKLSNNIKFNEFVQPACVANSTKRVRGIVEVAGWGYIDNFETVAKKLQYVTLPIVSFETCQRIYHLNPRHADDKYCAGKFDGMDSCGGDSGGPMTKEITLQGKRVNFVVGLVSYGLEKCGYAPAVYANVANFMTWIFDTTME